MFCPKKTQNRDCRLNFLFFPSLPLNFFSLKQQSQIGVCVCVCVNRAKRQERERRLDSNVNYFRSTKRIAEYECQCVLVLDEREGCVVCADVRFVLYALRFCSFFSCLRYQLVAFDVRPAFLSFLFHTPLDCLSKGAFADGGRRRFSRFRCFDSITIRCKVRWCSVSHSEVIG